MPINAEKCELHCAEFFLDLECDQCQYVCGSFVFVSNEILTISLH